MCRERRAKRIGGGTERDAEGISDNLEDVAMMFRGGRSVAHGAVPAQPSIASGHRSHRAVLPSMSVKRNVTVPDGGSHESGSGPDSMSQHWVLPSVQRAVREKLHILVVGDAIMARPR